MLHVNATADIYSTLYTYLPFNSHYHDHKLSFSLIVNFLRLLMYSISQGVVDDPDYLDESGQNRRAWLSYPNSMERSGYQPVPSLLTCTKKKNNPSVTPRLLSLQGEISSPRPTHPFSVLTQPFSRSRAVDFSTCEARLVALLPWDPHHLFAVVRMLD